MSTSRNRLTLLVCLAIALGWAGFSAAQMMSRIMVTIVDHEDNPIKGAEITVTCRHLPDYKDVKKTNKKGRAIFAFTDGTTTYEGVILADGYQGRKVNIKPQLGGTAELKYDLYPDGMEIPGMEKPTPTPEQIERQMRGDKKLRLYNEGADAQNSGDFDTALAKYQEVLTIDDRFAVAYTGMAAALIGKGEYEAAAQAAEQAIALDPSDFRALYFRFDAFRRLGDKEKAKEASRELSKIGDIKDVAKTIYNEAVQAYNAGDTEKAKSVFRQALDLDPELTEGYRILALIYFREGNFEQAEIWATDTLKRDPGDVNSMKIRYNSLRALGRNDEAKQALAQVVAADPEWAANDLLNHAHELFNANQIEQARDALEEYLKLEPDKAEAHYLLALCLNSSGEIEKAKVHFKRFLELAPDHPDAAVARDILKYLP